MTNTANLFCAKFRGVWSCRSGFIAIFWFYDVIFVWSVKYTNGRKKISDIFFLNFFFYFLSKYKNALLLIWTYRIPFVWQIHPYCFFKFNDLELALGMALKFCESVAKGLKLNIRKFLGLISTFVEVTGEKLVGDAFWPSTSSIGLIYFQKK